MGVLVRLRLTLLHHQLTGGVEKVVLLVLGTVFAAGLSLGGVAALVALRLVPLDLAGAAVVVFGSLAVVGWAVLPALTSTDDVLNDPLRFALLPVPSRSLAAGLLVATALTPFAVATLLVAAATAVTFARGPAPAVAVLVALLSAALATLTCLLGSRTLLTAASTVLAGRRGREVSIGLGVLVVSLLGLTGPALAEIGEQLQTGGVDAAVQVLAWSPLGAAWSLPWAAAEGRWDVLGGRAVVALATPVVLWLVYLRAVRARLRPTGGARGPRTDRAARTERVRTPATSRRSLLPDTPLGALVQRCLRYWVRDSRYVVSVVALPVVVGLLLGLPALTDAPAGFALATGPLLGLLLGITMLNELAFDGGALWTSLAAGVRGRDDRTARVVALLVWGVPFVVAVSWLGAVVSGRPEFAPAGVGLGLAALLVGNAVAAVTSVVLAFSVPPAGSNPFAGNPGAGTAALVQQGLSVLVLVPLLLPVLALGVWAFFVPVVGWVVLVVGTVYGGALLVVGVVVGGREYDRRGPELLARLSR